MVLGSPWLAGAQPRNYHLQLGYQPAVSGGVIVKPRLCLRGFICDTGLGRREIPIGDNSICEVA